MEARLGMRWFALGVDYEWPARTLNSARLSRQCICRLLGGLAPEGFTYELFLDERGRRSRNPGAMGSRSRNGCAMRRRKACRCSCTANPGSQAAVLRRHSRDVDEYQQYLEAYAIQDGRQRLTNPVWHIHAGAPPAPEAPIAFSMLLKLVSASNAESPETLWGFIDRYRPGLTPQTHPRLDRLVGYAIHYFRDFVLPAKHYRNRARTNAARSSICARPCHSCPPTRAQSEFRRSFTRSATRTVFGSERQDQDQGRQAGGLARVVQHALRGALRRAERTAFWLLRGGLWN